MNKPSQGTLDVLTELRELANDRDRVDGGLAEEMKKIVASYEDWLNGPWEPSLEHARGYFREVFFCAIEEARRLGFQDMSAAMIALKPDIFGEEEE